MKKNIIILIIFLIPQLIFAKLPVFFDCNKFLNENGNTIFEITHKISHKDLQFKFFEEKYHSQIEIDFSILNQNDEKLYNKKYSALISINPQKIVNTSEEFYIDKIIAEVKPGIYQLVVKISDMLNENSITWNKTFHTINPDKISISDIEINSFCKSDTTESFANFKRDNIIFLVNPNHLINPEIAPNFVYYFEIYKPNKKIDEFYNLHIEISSKFGSVHYQKDEKMQLQKYKKVFYDSVSVANWESGSYEIFLTIFDSSGNKITSSNEILYIKKGEKKISKKDAESEYKFAKYFLTSQEKRIYENLDNKSKIDFLEKFWRENDPNPISEVNEFKREIIQRTEYANQNFSHFEDGWKTDRGRIYIRFGKPEDVIDRSFNYRAKPYIIWKYYGFSGGKKVYIFVDFSGQGNYKLVYRENDEKECTDPNWANYLGPYFDVRELE